MEEKQEKQKLKESGVNNLYYGGILFLFRKNLGRERVTGEGRERVCRGACCVYCDCRRLIRGKFFRAVGSKS
jgi:hypothetical protein